VYVDDEVEVEDAEDEIDESPRVNKDSKKRSFFLEFDTGEVPSCRFKAT
jgi:hypothetical protein